MTGFTLSRRGFLGAAAAAGAMGPALADAASPPSVEVDHGRVRPPIALPAIPLTLDDGSATTLASLVQRRATAIQIMFPICTTICPIGAATFSQVQTLLPDQMQRGITLLSLDIAPTGDRPETLASWLRRYGARAGWRAASPDSSALQTVQTLFDQGRNFSEDHSNSVHIVSRDGRVVWRTYELPAAEEIAALLLQL